MKLLICAGGTGGGVYPALAVLQAVINKLESKEKESGGAGETSPGSIDGSKPILWVGSVGGMEEKLVIRAGIPFEAISAAGVHGVGLKVLPGNLIKLSKGYLQSRKILNTYRPDVLFFTGGYVAVPMAFAGYKIPSLLYVPDIEPGLALKTIAFTADIIAVTSNETQKYLSPHKDIRIAGYPTREDLLSWNRSDACTALNLSPDLPVLLVLGGSRGARSINNALLAAIPELIEVMQVIHVSGTLDWPEVESTWKEMQYSILCPDRYQAFPYLHEQMGAALRAATLVVSRAGASVLGDYPSLGLPAIVVPYPHTWRYQMINAKILEQRGAAHILLDEDLTTQLVPVVLELIMDVEKLGKMSLAMSSMAKPYAAQTIAEHLFELAERDGMKN